MEVINNIFTSPTFVADKLIKEKREFYIPRQNREKSLYGTESEIRLFEQVWQDRDKLTDVTEQVAHHISTVNKEN